MISEDRSRDEEGGKEAHPFQRCAAKYDEANEHYARYRAIDGGHNKFKQELVADIADRATSSHSTSTVSSLTSAGPHVPHTGWLKQVKLTKVSGS